MKYKRNHLLNLRITSLLCDAVSGTEVPIDRIESEVSFRHQFSACMGIPLGVAPYA